jgi:leucyl/phenylalanyl-tRNA--protein transferase
MSELLWLHPLEPTLFPRLDQALDDPNGLIAAGGDLSLERLITAYQKGIFPWYEEGQPILWWSPDPRTVLYPEHFILRRSLRKAIRNKPWTISFDRNFDAVIRACAQPRPGSTGTWITDEMITAYNRLHIAGHAHSVEVWDDESRLIGGLYGVAIGGVFFGESMFSLASEASKVAYAYLVCHLQHWGYRLIDCQIESEHLLTLGAETIRRNDFSAQVENWIKLEGRPAPWSVEPALVVDQWDPETGTIKG